MDRLWNRVGYPVFVAACCAVGVCGCAEFNVPRIDPTGQHIFADPVLPSATSFHEEPGPLRASDPVELLINPQVTVAPVGSEVVLAAGVRGQDQYLITNERVEWTIDPAGVGEFVDVQPGTFGDLLLGDYTKPKKIDATHAVGSTSRQNVRLTRGTPTTDDDVCVLRGQTWVTVTSPAEGTSYVTAFARSVYGWEQRKQTAVVHWVDAQWRFPPPAINPAGTRHVFTTTVMRQTDQAPLAGWRVRYQIVDGPPAGFAPGGGQSIEVETNAMGQASAEIFQPQPASGTNRVGIQIVRPATARSSQIVVGHGSTLKTWSAPGIAVRKSGPALVGIGGTATYQIQVTNPGDMPADGVVLVDEIPEIMSYVGSRPPAELAGRSLRWQLGRLGPGGGQAVEVTLRAERPGSAASCAEAAAAGGLKARHCATTTVMAASLDLRVVGPDRANVGEEAAFEILVTNPSEVTYNDLVIRDRFDAGLQHAKAANPIERRLLPLGPHQSVRVGIAFRVVQPGQWCHTVELIEGGVVRATARACVTAAAGLPVVPPGTPLVTPPPGTPLPSPAQPPGATPQPPGKLPEAPPGVPPTSPPSISVKISGPALKNVGETALFNFEVTNTGGQTLTNVKLINEAPKELEAGRATSGYSLEGDNLAWTIETLPSGRTNRYAIEYKCVQASERACNRAQVTSEQKVQGKDELCMEIRGAKAPPSAGLRMDATNLHNPVTQGSELTYVIQVLNQGQGPDSNIVLEFTVPPQMAPVRLQTTGPEGLSYTIQDQTIRFNPVAKLDVGQSLSYRIRVRAKEGGKEAVEVVLRAKLTSQNLQQPLVVEDKTRILPPR